MSIDCLEITIAGINSAKWPTLIEAPIASNRSELPRFPFNVNPNALKIFDYRRELNNLEGLLSTICTFEFEWTDIETVWLPDKDDKLDGLLLNYRVSAVEPNRSQVRAEDLWMAVSASTGSDDRLAALSHLKQANLNFSRGYYIDATRHSLFLIEHLFADGQYNTAAVKAAYKSSLNLQRAFTEWVSVNNKFFKKLLEKCGLATTSENDFLSFADALVYIRGRLQHANAFLARFWSSAKHEEFEAVALALISFADSVAFGIRQELFKETLTQNGWKDASMAG